MESADDKLEMIEVDQTLMLQGQLIEEKAKDLLAIKNQMEGVLAIQEEIKDMLAVQGGQLDKIEDNIDDTKNNVEGATDNMKDVNHEII